VRVNAGIFVTEFLREMQMPNRASLWTCLESEAGGPGHHLSRCG